MTATILGEAELLRKLTILPDRMVARIRVALAEQADEIVGMMIRLAPPHIKPAIHWRWGRRKTKKGFIPMVTGEVVRGRFGKLTQGNLVITIYCSEWTAHWFEFGTAARHHKTGKYVGLIASRPFFYVSWRAGRKGARGAVQAAVRSAAREVAAGG